MRNNEDRFNPAPVEQQSAVPGLQYVVPTELVDLPSKGKFYPQNHPLHEKEFIEIKGANHNDLSLVGAGIYESGIKDFLNSIVEG